jgi:hypothetical protein
MTSLSAGMLAILRCAQDDNWLYPDDRESALGSE